jgi:hypothetical protein
MALRKRRPGLVYPTWADWIYVGSGGSAPAFGTDWTNVGTPWPALAFRHREAGAVDIIGTVEAGVSASGTLFTLPVGYRPNEQAVMPIIRQRSSTQSGQLLIISDSGGVEAADSGEPSDIVYIAGSFFLDTAAP